MKVSAFDLYVVRIVEALRRFWEKEAIRRGKTPIAFDSFEYEVFLKGDGAFVSVYPQGWPKGVYIVLEMIERSGVHQHTGSVMIENDWCPLSYKVDANRWRVSHWKKENKRGTEVFLEEFHTRSGSSWNSSV